MQCHRPRIPNENLTSISSSVKYWVNIALLSTAHLVPWAGTPFWHVHLFAVTWSELVGYRLRADSHRFTRQTLSKQEKNKRVDTFTKVLYHRHTQQPAVSYLDKAQCCRALWHHHCSLCPRVWAWGYCKRECARHSRTTHCMLTTTTSHRQLCVRGTSKSLSRHN